MLRTTRDERYVSQTSLPLSAITYQDVTVALRSALLSVSAGRREAGRATSPNLAVRRSGLRWRRKRTLFPTRKLNPLYMVIAWEEEQR